MLEAHNHSALAISAPSTNSKVILHAAFSACCSACQMLHKCSCVLQMPKLVPLEWAAVHQVMSSHEVLMSTSPDAWRALVGVWSAMSAHCTPDELLTHIEQLALALSSKAALPGWTKLDFPAGLMMAMALLTTRYPNQTATMCLCTVVD